MRYKNYIIIIIIIIIIIMFMMYGQWESPHASKFSIKLLQLAIV